MALTFNNLKELEAYLLIQVQKAMDNTVAPEVKTLESQNVEDIVYSYDPSTYERRMDNGGLADIDNMHHEIKISGNSIGLTVENKTMSNPDYNPYNKSPFEIAGLVEYGDNSGYGNYDYPYGNKNANVFEYLQPRPFIEKTIQELSGGKAKEILVKGLIKEGIKAK